MIPLSAIQPGQGRIGSVDATLDRARYALSLPFKSIYELLGKSKGRKAIVCGGGPSIKDTLPEIRRQLRLSKKCDVIALNKTHDWLIDKGVDPRRIIGVMIDPKEWVAYYQTPTKGVRYYLGTKLHKGTLDRFLSHKDQVWLWNVWEHRQEEVDTLGREFPHIPVVHIPGFSTVGLRAINLCYDLGYRSFELHGFDSSHKDGTHAYEKDVPRDDNEDLTIVIDGRDGTARGYYTDVHMARQIKEFFELMDQFEAGIESGERDPIEVTVAGAGALQYSVAQKFSRGRTIARHLDPKWQADPNSMPGGFPTDPIERKPAFEVVEMGNSFHIDLSGIEFTPGELRS